MRYCACYPAAWLLAVAFVAVLGAGCAANPVTGDEDFVLLSHEDEIQLGRKGSKQVEKQYNTYSDEQLQNYVARIGQRIAANSDRAKLDYHFEVLDSPTVNAFSLPGGWVYIERGILSYIDSEAELAGILGHEIGHVAARHSVKQYSAQKATSLFGGLLVAATDAGQAGGQLFKTGQMAALRSYSRSDELQADRLGAKYMARAGYDPQDMLGVVGILADQEDYARKQAQAEGREAGGYHGVFASHPANDQRLQEVVQAARKHKIADPRPADHAGYLHQIDGMTFGPSADQGTVVDHTFLHRQLDTAIAAPDDWKIANQPKQVVFQAPESAATLQTSLLQQADGSTNAGPRERLRKKIGARVSKGRSLDIDGGQGYSGIAQGRTKRGRRRIRVAVVIRDDRAWFFAGAARKKSRFERFDRDFVDIITSIHALTARERKQARPLHIRIRKAKADTTYSQLAQGVTGVRNGPARLRLLNGDWPDQSPTPGHWIKTLGR